VVLTPRMAGAATLGGLGALELAAATARSRTRRETFLAAQERAAELSRPLVVVGDPDGGAWTGTVGRAYDCGELCVDLNGCPACPLAIRADISKPLPIGSDSAVVFVSCVLEYVPDFPAAWSELSRVAGSPDNLFVATVQPWTLTAALYPGAQQTLSPVFEQGRIVSYRPEPVSTWRKVVTVGVLVGLAALVAVGGHRS
jgi:hypothetical protein